MNEAEKFLRIALPDEIFAEVVVCHHSIVIMGGSTWFTIRPQSIQREFSWLRSPLLRIPLLSSPLLLLMSNTQCCYGGFSKHSFS